MINIGMAVSFNIEGQAYSFPDWSTESTSKQMVDIVTEIAKANGVSGKALAELKKTNEDMLKATTKANKKEEKTAEEHKELTEEQKQKMGEEAVGRYERVSEKIASFETKLKNIMAKAFIFLHTKWKYMTFIEVDVYVY